MGDLLILPEPALIGLVAGFSFIFGMIAMATGMYYTIKENPHVWIRAIRREMLDDRVTRIVRLKPGDTLGDIRRKIEEETESDG